jgi:hypothetical protein
MTNSLFVARPLLLALVIPISFAAAAQARTAIVLQDKTALLNQPGGKALATFATGDVFEANDMRTERANGKETMWAQVSSGTLKGWMSQDRLLVLDDDGVLDSFLNATAPLKQMLLSRSYTTEEADAADVDTPEFYLREIKNPNPQAKLHAARRGLYFVKDEEQAFRLWKGCAESGYPEVASAANTALRTTHWIRDFNARPEFANTLRSLVTSMPVEFLNATLQLFLQGEVPESEELLLTAARRGSIAAMGMSTRPEAANLLLARLQDSDPETRTQVIANIGNHASPEVSKALVRAYARETPTNQRMIVEVIPFADPSVVEWYRRVLRDKKTPESARISAIQRVLQAGIDRTQDRETLIADLPAAYRSLEVAPRSQFANAAGYRLYDPAGQALGGAILEDPSNDVFESLCQSIDQLSRQQRGGTQHDSSFAWLAAQTPTVKDPQRKARLEALLNKSTTTPQR